MRVDRDVIADDGTVRLSESRYFASSLDPDHTSAAQLLEHARDHWQVENSLFFVKDRWWDEDRHWTRRPGVAEWLAYLTTAAITVLRLLRDPRRSLRDQADRIAWRPTRGLEWLRHR